MLWTQLSIAQPIDNFRIIPPEGTTPRTFEEKLVQWAWLNSPGNLVYKEQLDIAAKKINLTWWELLDARATFNINEFHFGNGGMDSTSLNNNLFFPKFNFGVNVNLGALFSRPARKKIAQAEKRIIELEEMQRMMVVKSAVLQRYQEYELALELLKSKTQAAEEAASVYTLVREQFENDKVDFRDFSAASASFHGANEAKAIAQTDVNKAKIVLEEYIGIPWDKAVKRRRKK